MVLTSLPKPIQTGYLSSPPGYNFRWAMAFQIKYEYKILGLKS